jgi:hypothetical protein
MRLAPLASAMLIPQGMSGFITESEFEEAEAEFPGIEDLYRRLERKPSTFLNLLQLYLAGRESGGPLSCNRPIAWQS